jgi:hypothetical protein
LVEKEIVEIQKRIFVEICEFRDEARWTKKSGVLPQQFLSLCCI